MPISIGFEHKKIGVLYKFKWVFMAIFFIGFKHQEYPTVYYAILNRFLSIKNIGVYNMKIKLGFHGNLNINGFEHQDYWTVFYANFNGFSW